jgi:hypothetical protein
MYRRLTRFFERLDEVVRYAVYDIPPEQRWGTYIVLQGGHGRRIEWDEIKELYASLGGLPNSA